MEPGETGEDTGQGAFSFRFDWGLAGLRALAPTVDVVVIVDVLRFSTAVTAALESGSTVLPHPWHDDGATEYAASRGALLAGDRGAGGPSLSPTDLLTRPPGERIVLPSPNGATLSFAARELGARRVIAGCLRNASAVARHIVNHFGSRADVAVIAAGERWPDGTLRPAVEDLIGAGAILAALDPSGAVANPSCSPEARAARVAYLDARPRLFDALRASASGRELSRRGWDDDIATSAALDVTDVVGELADDTFVRL
ncbi:MAG: putative lipoprotein [Ilumatobacteraceae bacterium]|nr:putative lipoprotein [Ilumatobacteraceae bacterium]